MHRVVVCAAVFGWAAGLLVAPPATAGNKCRNAPARTSADFLSPGPYAVSQRTYTFVDESRPTAPNGTYPGAPSRTLVTEVWFPATSSGGAFVDESGGPYPIIMSSHGFLSNRLGLDYLATHLASRGYVVGSVNYPLSHIGAPGGATAADVHNQPGDLSFARDRIVDEFGAVIDGDRMGAQGLSLGGLTTELATFHADLRDPRIDAALALAPPACFFTKRFFKTATTPFMVVHGDDDQLVPYKENGRRAFKFARAPKHLVALRAGSHTGFSTFARGQDGSTHIDVVGCAAVLQNPPSTDGAGFTDLGGKEQGVSLDPKRCPALCGEGLPDHPSMGGARHHELTKIAVAAFFEAYLQDDVAARCFLRKTMRREHDDIVVKGR
jgi:predicted dienelactone hydrolase